MLADRLGVAGRLDDMTVLELGPLEGAHTYQLEKLGAKHILAIEANVEAFLKCLIVKEITKLRVANFMLGDFTEYLANTLDKYDVVMCSGVLYHMSDPLALIAAIARVTSKCFVWTHYFDESRHPGPPRALSFDSRYPGVELYALPYYDDMQSGRFWGGNQQTSMWLKRDDILHAFAKVGFASIEILDDEPDHPNGPSLTFTAMTSPAHPQSAATRFHVDVCDINQIAGWISREGRAVALTVEINGKWISDFSSTQFRSDLQDAGIGDGRYAFSFPLAGYLTKPLNKVSLKLQGKEIYSKLIASIGQELNPFDSATDSPLVEFSQRRWRGDEPDAGLTWGSTMDAESLWSVYQSAREFSASDKILEIGPGYGRLLLTAIDQKVPFASYVGVELSESRVERLRSRFRQSGILFFLGDVNDWLGNDLFDVILCSSTFEHLYPNCMNALRNLRNQLERNGWMFIDFIYSQEARYWFEEDTAFVRCYTEFELRDMFKRSGLEVIDVVATVLGTAVTGQPIKRNVIIARHAAGR
jgi:2-polyprenyl-3-methyl-5-hydroxy-6-metoxy-1,4-benzoquinol methylase